MRDIIVPVVTTEGKNSGRKIHLSETERNMKLERVNFYMNLFEI